MTICIAALCQGGMIFGASDRMITTGDIEYDPLLTGSTPLRTSTLKVLHLTNSIAVMTAGDVSVHSEILQYVSSAVRARITQDPSNWWGVSEVAQLYVRHYDNLRRSRGESALLAPVGLSNETFIGRQSDMSNEFIQTVTHQLTTFSMPIVEAIITGVDREGSHIYVLNNYNRNHSCVISCADIIGFAAIGSGSHHAESLFMLAGHHRNSPIPDTLFLTYLAKKRAEVAPGVGVETDMLMAGANLGSLQNLTPRIVQEIGAIYRNFHTQEQQALSTARLQATEWVDNLARSAQAQQPQESPASATEVRVEPPRSNQ